MPYRGFMHIKNVQFHLFRHGSKLSLPDIAKASLPGPYPQWSNGENDTIEVKITGLKKNSALFPKNQKPHVFDEITGVDRVAMETYVDTALRWYEHYDLYYGITGWTYEVKWKEKKAK